MRPRIKCFGPTETAFIDDNQTFLTLDELEALRLADLMGLYHDEAAGLMGISRATFGRIIEEARRKIAYVLINGTTLIIEGGNTELKRELSMPQGYGQGRGGQGQGRGKRGRGDTGGPPGAGPSGTCVCTQCGHQEPHERGIPCTQKKCPECGAVMVRQ